MADLIDTYSVPLTTIVKEFELQVVHAATDYESIQITVEDVARPGMQLAGYFEHFDPMRLQVLGNVEMSYLSKLSAQERRRILDRLFSYKFPALLITRNIPPDEISLEMARKHNVTLLRSDEPTSTITSALISYLKSVLAPRVTRHGVLMEVYGEGVLIIGESGIGKSENAVELLKRGHRLIADDAVEIRKVSGSSLIGTAPKLVRNYVELRGIGIINARDVYGARAVKSSADIDLIINLEYWDETKFYDRLGLDTEYEEIMGVKVPCVTVPVRPGRNIGIIIELATLNNRMKKMGQNAAQNLADEMTRQAEMMMAGN